MTIRLDELAGWKLVKPGEALMLASEREDPRLVRINLNCEVQTWVFCAHVGTPDGVDDQFVAVVGPGLETVTFHAVGDLRVSFARSDDAAQVWLQTSELEPNVQPNPGAASFTEIAQRRARNPELEMMQFYARQNERRMDAALAEQRAVLEEIRAAREPVNVDPVETEVVADVASKPAKRGAKGVSASAEPDGSEQPDGDESGAS